MAPENLTANKNDAEDSQFLAQHKRIFALISQWSLKTKIALSAMIIFSIIIFSYLIQQIRIADYQLLYSNLSKSDSFSIAHWLEQRSVPYLEKKDGKDLWIQANRIYHTRLELAENGLPTSGQSSYEFFDKNRLSLTDYVQKVNHLRALQAELARSITTLDSVSSTRVLLSITQEKADQSTDPSASIFLTMLPGKQLKPEQVQGIIHLVSGSVAGLKPEHVTLIDSTGMVISHSINHLDTEYASSNMLLFQQQVERRLEKRAQDLLDRILGPHMALIKIGASVDFTRTEKTLELYDPEEPVVKNEEFSQESGDTQDQGINADDTNTTTSGVKRTSRVTQYEISKTTSKTVIPVGTIQRLSVSVLLANKQSAGSEQIDAGELVTTEELESIKEIVSGALALDTQRGDTIKVLAVPFIEPMKVPQEYEPHPTNQLYDYLPLIKIGLIAVACLLFYLLLIRPLIKLLKNEISNQNRHVEELERERGQLLKASQKEEDAALLLKKEVLHNPMPTAHIVKSWIQES